MGQLISQLPSEAAPVGSDLLELQRGEGTDASRHTTLALAVQKALDGIADPCPQYLTAAEGNAAYEAAGALAVHAGQANPHSQYVLVNGLLYESKTASFTAVAHGRYLLANSGITVTLPVNPGTGTSVHLLTLNGSLTNLVVARNGQNIMGLAENMGIDKDIGFSLVFSDATNGWRLA